MSRRVVVLGAAVTPFEREPAKRMDEQAIDVSLAALREAGMTYSDIQIGFASNVYQPGMAPLVYYSLAKTGIPITRIDIACASATRAVDFAACMIEGGAYETALIVGVERMPRGMVPMPIDPEAMSSSNEMLHDAMMGLITMPGSYAYKAVRYMHNYEATPEQFAQVAVKNHHNACLNPNAMYQKEMSIEEIMASRMVSYPLTLFQCCANSSGAAAVILCAEEKARQYTKDPIFLTGWAGASMKYDPHDPVETTLSEGDTEGAAERAYAKAGIGPDDIDVAQVHDAFSFGEILQIEALGLCPKGEGAARISKGEMDINARTPVNTDGGLLGCGHPLGASGCRMIAELFWQLKGVAGQRQIEKHKVAVLQNSGLGGSNVMVFQR